MISTIFIPLSFICGLYGMNFDSQRSPWNMPELSSYWGYPGVLIIMFLIIVGMLIYFKRMGWVGTPRDTDPAGDEQENPQGFGDGQPR